VSLILGVKEGEVIYLNDEKLVVLYIKGMASIRVKVLGKEYEITDLEATEVYPGVLVSCGLPTRTSTQVSGLLPRLVLDAPSSITILRKTLYEKARAGKKGVHTH